MTFSDFANYVSTISGIMTILGIGGIISWGVAERTRNTFAARVVLILSYSIKTALVCALLIPLKFVWQTLYVVSFRYIGDGTFSYVNPYWYSSAPITNIVVYVISLGGVVPL